ncbi:MAG: tetratricopeptide repeat protein [Pseudomonadota bacterium]
MRYAKVGIFLTASLALSACDMIAGDPTGPYAPGVSSRAATQSVDGLVVGHRLMDAGEYELALKAYYRAGATHGMNADVLSALGSANLKLGRLYQAERTLREAVKKDETFVPAWNNLGVVLMEQGNYGEAALVFRRAFALDSGESVDIRDNLAIALAKIENPAYLENDESGPELMRRGTGDYLLLSTPN